MYKVYLNTDRQYEYVYKQSLNVHNYMFGPLSFSSASFTLYNLIEFNFSRQCRLSTE